MQTALSFVRSSSILRRSTVNEKCSQNKNIEKNVCAINNANELASAYKKCDVLQSITPQKGVKKVKTTELPI